MKKKLLSKMLLVLFLSAILIPSVFGQEKYVCIIGDATRNGYNKDNATPMMRDATNSSVFYYKGYLKANDFKFQIEKGDWVPSWNKDATDPTNKKLLKRKTYADPDEKFFITAAGNYTVTIDTTLLTIDIQPMSETTPIYFNAMFMIGGATSGGWNLDNATQLIRNPNNLWEFSFSGPLKVGDFKLSGTRGNFDQEFFMKTTDNQMFLGTTPDSKWEIAEADDYEITMNTNTMAINIVKKVHSNVENNQTSSFVLKSTVVTDELYFLPKNNCKFSIYSLNGAYVKSGVTERTISVSEMNQGMYIIKINDSFSKFIKK